MLAPVQTKQEILNILKINQSYLKKLGVKRIGLFGSFVRGQQHSRSDLDFLVEFEPKLKTFDNFIALATWLEDHLQRKVEVVTTEALSPYIGPHILREVEYAAFSA
jgi:uncharacterized protein